MTQEMQEMIKDVARYEGYTPRINEAGLWINPNEQKPSMWFDKFTYHTSIEALYPVAKRVVGELENLYSALCDECTAMPILADTQDIERKIEYALKRIASIKSANNNFDIPSLFPAVHAGITILQSQNKNENA